MHVAVADHRRHSTRRRRTGLRASSGNRAARATSRYFTSPACPVRPSAGVYKAMGKRFSFRNPPELPAYPRRRRRLRLSLTTRVDFPNCLDNFEMKNGSSSIRVQGVEQFIDVTQPLTGAMHYPSKSKVAASDENRQPQVGHRCSLLPRAVSRGVVSSASITTCL